MGRETSGIGMDGRFMGKERLPIRQAGFLSVCWEKDSISCSKRKFSLP
jgi:hypothetical protein